jgi:hypothetical protein
VRRTTRAGMEPSRRGAANTCRVVVSTPTAFDSGPTRGATESALGASLFDHLGHAVAVFAGR